MNDDLEHQLRKWNEELKRNPEDPSSWFWKGNVLHDLQKKEQARTSYEEALRCCEKLLKAHPRRDLEELKGAILNSLGNVLCDLNLKKEALKSYKKALCCCEKPLEAHQSSDFNNLKAMILNNLGNVLSNLKRKHRALKCYNEALGINSNYAAAWHNQGNVLYDLKDNDKALECYDKALKHNPKYISAEYNKGKVLYDPQKKDEALQCYQKVIQLDTHHQYRGRLLNNPLFWACVEDNSQVDLWSGDHNYQALIKEQELLKQDDSFIDHIHQLWVEQYRMLYLLRSDLEEVAHYTSSDVFEILLSAGKEQLNPLKLCSLAAANDPTEGVVFAEFLQPECVSSLRTVSRLAALQISFSANIDSLNQFRLYGKKNGEEGTGVCLVFNKDFFAKSHEASLMVAKSKDVTSEETTCAKLPLYWVLYYDRHTRRFYHTPACVGICLNQQMDIQKLTESDTIQNKLEKIGQSLRRIQQLFHEIQTPEIQEIALEMLIYLRHLIKDAAFMDEKELRILSLHPYDYNKLSVLEGKNCLARDYLPIIDEQCYLSEVITGPKVKNFNNLVDVSKFKLHGQKGGQAVKFSQSRAPLN